MHVDTTTKQLKYLKTTNDNKRLGIVYSLSGATYEAQGAWEDAIIEYKRSSSIFKKIGDNKRQQRIDINIDEIHDERSITKTYTK